MRLLTKRKTAWVARRKPDVLRGSALIANAATRMRYSQQLEKAVDQMAAETMKAIMRFYKTPDAKQFFAEDASVASQARILANALMKKYDDLFSSIAKPAAESMVKGVDKNSAASLQGSLKQISGGLTFPTTILTGELNEILSATVTANVGLIKSIPQQYLTGVQDAFMRSITTGNGLQDLVPYLQNHKGITLRRARMIAKDQTRKTFNNLNKGRMQKLGIGQFEWLHSGGADHPRPEHVKMSGNIYSFDDLPVIDSKTGERGIPGQLPNCGCTMIPVIPFLAKPE